MFEFESAPNCLKSQIRTEALCTCNLYLIAAISIFAASHLANKINVDQNNSFAYFFEFDSAPNSLQSHMRTEASCTCNLHLIAAFGIFAAAHLANKVRVDRNHHFVDARVRLCPYCLQSQIQTETSCTCNLHLIAAFGILPSCEQDQY